MNILVADDCPDVVELLEYNLSKAGYTVFTASNGKDALELCRETTFELIILDIVMPVLDGVETCLRLRDHPLNRQAIIVFLTGRSEDYSQISGLEAGADDYIIKPVKPRVFISKVKSLIRRRQTTTTRVRLLGDLSIDSEKFQVFHKQRTIDLARKEFHLLELLASRPGSVFTRNEILEKIWGNEAVVGERTVDVHIQKLRNKIGTRYIKTIIGVGYKMDS